MNSSEFEEKWQKDIVPALASLEVERKKAKKEFWGLIILLVPPILAWFSLSVVLPTIEISTITFILVLILMAVGLYLVLQNKNTFKESYKEKIFLAIIKETEFHWQLHFHKAKNWWESVLQNRGKIYDGLSGYTGATAIEEFKTSALYGSFDSVVPDDVLRATYQNRDVSVVEYKVTETRGSGKNRHTVVIFEGFMVTITFDRPFQGETYVKTEIDRISGFGRTPSGAKVTTLEWREFEKFLEVHTSDPIEAREIFTPDFMQVIYDWWVEHKQNVRFAFKENKVYIAVPSKHTFEANAFHSMEKEKEAIKDHLELLQIIEHITKLLLYHQRLKINPVLE